MKRLVIILILLLAVRAGAAIYYVNATGGDDARDTATASNPATPWLTLNGAEAKAANGDTVHVAAGTYNEDDASLHACYLQKAITWIGDAGAATTIVTSTSTAYVLVASGSTVASWAGFTFDGEDADTEIVRISAGGDTKTFTNCTFKDPVDATGKWVNVSAAGSDTLAWNACTFTSNGGLAQCFTLLSAINVTITGCTITGTSAEGTTASGASGTLTISNNTVNLTATGAGLDFVTNSGSQHMVITGNNVTFAGTPSTFVSVTGAGSTGNFTVQNNTLTSTVKISSSPILVATGTHTVNISDNTLSCTAATQTADIITVTNQANPLIHGNTITTTTTANSPVHIIVNSSGTDCGTAQVTDNTCWSYSTGNQVILVGADSTGAGDNMLDGAIISGNDVRGGLYYNRAANPVTIHGIEFGWNSDASIFNNKVDGCAYGIVAKGGSEDYGDAGGVYYNLLINNGGTNAVNDSSIRLKGVVNVPVYNNVLYLHADYAMGAAGGLLNITEGDDAGDNASGCLVKNNIFYAADGIKHVRVANDGSSLTATDVDNNCYWNSAGANMDFMVGATTYTAFSGVGSWQAAGFDASGISANPLWVTPGTDWHLQAGSPCINAGTDLGDSYDEDYAGDDQDDYGLWESGAYVYKAGKSRGIGGGIGRGIGR